MYMSVCPCMCVCEEDGHEKREKRNEEKSEKKNLFIQINR